MRTRKISPTVHYICYHVPVDQDFWRARWEEGRIGFHRDEIHPALEQFRDRFDVVGHRVLVPLCGKSRDVAHLAESADEVVGIELVESAVEELFAEANLAPEVEIAGPYRRFHSGRLIVYCGDIFAAGKELFGAFDRIWDRAALIALDEGRRRQYIEVIRSLAAPGATLLQSCVEYDQDVMSGPPWSVTAEDIHAYYGDLSVELLYRDESLNDRWRERGHQHWYETGYLIEFPI